MRRLVIATVAVGLLSAAAWYKLAAYRPHRGAESPATETADLKVPVPEFALTERGGKPVAKADLLGKVWVASFVFTRCSGPCPAVTATVAKLQDDLKDVPDVRFVTFTVDPDRDDAGELKKYADRFRADQEKWLFLTGPEKTIHTLMKDGFLLLVDRNPKGEPGQEFDHSTRLALVDKAGNVVGFYDGFPPAPGDPTDRFEAHQKALRDAVRALAK